MTGLGFTKVASGADVTNPAKLGEMVRNVTARLFKTYPARKPARRE